MKKQLEVTLANGEIFTLDKNATQLIVLDSQSITEENATILLYALQKKDIDPIILLVNGSPHEAVAVIEVKDKVKASI